MKNLALVAGIFALCLALALLATSWNDGSLTAHMIVHMTTVAIAAPLLAIAVSGRRLDPAVHLPWFGPLLASVAELIVVWLWHLPALRRLAETRLDAMLLEQASFLLAGILLWTTCFRRHEEGAQRLAGIIGLLFTSIHMTLLGVLLTLAPRPLYGIGDVTCLGFVLGRDTDQQLGGVVMLLVGAAAYMLGALILLADVLKPTSSRGNQCG
ncbi:cytochrome c oxidase assembly protein [Rhizobium leguminosarum]|uniref:cytochrome c oxidase assembly protein n=1 Tax=Rhizobium leguminosarum TaxID=384 RepID=UPI001C944614|nr:cytochrome c oxidase assembly protein [Rhizobium leguminosarum]MBY5592624.1 cytochrome c oxidase assembly protein [Rhizobium leguminosarum]MBY5600598.1 cytochrome c oxidase assembly protein [Rhizobium leguminosarum]MBY5697691.1 cytochrome c oxidase assembly protein [Rhizobium leguminosarum]